MWLPSALSCRGSFSLQKISEIQRRLEDERDSRACLYKKYRHALNILGGIDTTLLALIMGLGAGGVGLLSTVIAAPVAIGLKAGALSCGLTSAACKFAGRRLHTNAK